jgi:hypothetical protein
MLDGYNTVSISWEFSLNVLCEVKRLSKPTEPVLSLVPLDRDPLKDC